MNPEVKSAIDKLKIVKEMAQSPETAQVCKIMIELVGALEEKGQLGFHPNESKRTDKSKK